MVKVFISELDIPITLSTKLPDTILDILMGTRQIREGSKPSIEYQFKVLQSIKEAIKAGDTIQVVIPAGPKKPGDDGGFIDLAEYWFAKILDELANKIKSIYEPGIRFYIILEDASMAIFEPDVPREAAINYKAKFQGILDIMNFCKNISLVSESSLIEPHQLYHEGAPLIEPMYEYLQYSNSSRDSNIPKAIMVMAKLTSLGWQGGLSQETIEHYFQVFRRNYPEKTHDEILKAIALYLGISYARYKLQVRTNSFRNPIMINNAKRVPGVGFSSYDRVFYRTIPLYKTKTHIPFWRARGIIELSHEGFNTKLYPFNQVPDLEKNEVVLTQGDASAVIRVDFIEK
jgi:hypothetical protein